jgi:hypothetical protein
MLCTHQILGTCSTYGGDEMHRVLVGKPERIPLERPSCRWENNIKIFLLDVGWGDREWIDMSEDRDRWRVLVNVMMNFQAPQKCSMELGVV